MRRRSWALFAAMCVIWGVPYLMIRVAVRDFSPPVLVFLRTGLGGLVLLPFALRSGGFRPVLARWRPLLAFAAIEIALPWLLLSDAERVLSSSLAGILIAAVPMVGVVAAHLTRAPDAGGGWPRYAGLLVGFSGVVVLLGLDFEHVTARSLMEMLAVAVGYAVAPMIMTRRLADLSSYAVISASLLATAAVYLPFAVFDWPAHVGAKAVWSTIGLGTVCTALAFVLFFALIADIGPSRATVITYVNPAVAVLLGVLLLDEPFTTGIAIGFPLILVGSVLGARRRDLGETASPSDACVLEANVAETVGGEPHR